MLVAALVPSAAAQVFDDAVWLMMNPPPSLMPGGAAVLVPVVLEAGCGPLTLVPPGAVLTLSVERAPAWAAASVSPASSVFDALDCGVGNRFRFESVLSVAASSDAPAFEPEAVEVGAVVSWPDGSESSALGVIPVDARFVGHVELRPGVQALPAEHGQGVLFPIAVTNRGNGPTKISFELGGSDAGLRAAAPPPLVLERYRPGHESSSVVVFQAARMMAASDAALDVMLKFSSAYAFDANLAGNAGQLKFTLLPPGSAAPELSALDAPETLKPLPMPGFAGFLAVVGVISACLGRRF